MVTAAGVAHANRLPLLLLPGDTFTGRAPGPGAAAGRALRRPDHHGQRRVPRGQPLLRPDHPARAADRHAAAGRARAHRPGRLRPGRPWRCRRTCRPSSTTSRTRCSRRALHRVPRPRPGPRRAGRRPPRVRPAPQRPLLVLGGGVRYSGAGGRGARASPRRTASRSSRPPPAARWCRTTTRCTPAPLGIIGSTSANALAAEADVVLAVGTRLQDFTTASWTGVRPRRADRDGERRPVRRGQARRAGRGRRRARGAASSWPPGSAAGRRDPAWAACAAAGARGAGTRTSTGCAAALAPDGSLTYAQVVGVVNDASGPDDYVMTASGGMPGELHRRLAPAGHPARRARRWTSSTASPAWATSWPAPWGAAMARAAPTRRARHHAARRRLVPDAQLRAVLRGVRRAPFVAVRLRQRRLRRDPPAADRPGRRRASTTCSPTPAAPAPPAGVRVDFAAHARSLGCVGRGRAEPTAGSTDLRGGVRRRARERPVAERARPSWCAGCTRRRGPSPARGGRSACRRRCPAARRTTRPRRASSAGCDSRGGTWGAAPYRRPGGSAARARRARDGGSAVSAHVAPSEGGSATQPPIEPTCPFGVGRRPIP